MPDEDKTFSGSLVLGLRIWLRHVQSIKAGVHEKAVLTWLNMAFLPISRSRFKQRYISMLIRLTKRLGGFV